MRRTAVLHTLTVVALASAIVLACGEDAAPPQTPTSTSVLDPAPAEPPPGTAPSCEIIGGGDIRNDPRISLKVVEGILPSPAATSATLGLAPGPWVIAPNLGYEFALTFAGEGSGVTAGWHADYCSPSLASEPPEDMSVELFFHDTPEHAERTYEFFRGDLGNYGNVSQLADEPEKIADSVSLITGYPPVEPTEPTRTTILMRQGTVTATVQLRHGHDRDVTAGLREYARMLAGGIDEFAAAPPEPVEVDPWIEVIKGILPAPAATSATLGFPAGVWVLFGGLGQDFEHFEFEGSGLTDGRLVFFAPALPPVAGATPEGMYLSDEEFYFRPTPTGGAPAEGSGFSLLLSIAFHDTPENAERTYQFLRVTYEVQSEDERDTIADAVLTVALGGGGFIIRHHTVTVAVVILVPDGRDASAGLREFARMLVAGIDEFVRPQTP